jgi:hypothetical protein
VLPDGRFGHSPFSACVKLWDRVSLLILPRESGRGYAAMRSISAGER